MKLFAHFTKKPKIVKALKRMRWFLSELTGQPPSISQSYGNVLQKETS